MQVRFRRFISLRYILCEHLGTSSSSKIYTIWVLKQAYEANPRISKEEAVEMKTLKKFRRRQYFDWTYNKEILQAFRVELFSNISKSIEILIGL